MSVTAAEGGVDEDGVDEDEVAEGLAPINADQTTGEYLRAMWERREFAVEVPLEQMRSQHKTTLLGNAWHLGNPTADDRGLLPGVRDAARGPTGPTTSCCG